MWIRSQDKTKLYNLHNAQSLMISKSYGSRDREGNKLNSAIVLQHTSTNAVSLGLYACENDCIRILDDIARFMSEHNSEIFEMP